MLVVLDPVSLRCYTYTMNRRYALRVLAAPVILGYVAKMESAIPLTEASPALLVVSKEILKKISDWDTVPDVKWGMENVGLLMEDEARMGGLVKTGDPNDRWNAETQGRFQVLMATDPVTFLPKAAIQMYPSLDEYVGGVMVKVEYEVK